MKTLSNHIREIAVIAKHKGLIRTLKRFIEKENLPANNWPPYVKREIFEKIPLTFRDNYELTYNIDDTLKRLKTTEGLKTFDQFKLHFKPTPEIISMPMDLSSFTQESKNALKERINVPEGYEVRGVPHDKKRKEIQRKLTMHGINEEPVILIKHDKKYEIREGWHRIMELIGHATKKGQPSFNVNAYIGEEKPIKDILEKFKRFLLHGE